MRGNLVFEPNYGEYKDSEAVADSSFTLKILHFEKKWKKIL